MDSSHASTAASPQSSDPSHVAQPLEANWECSTDAAQNSEAELRAWLGAMTDVVLVLDREGRYLKIAPTNPSLLYKPPTEIIGKTNHEVLPTEQADRFVAHIQQTLDTRQNTQLEYLLEIGDRPLWFHATLSPLSENEVLWVARDITARKEAEEALRQQTASLEQTLHDLQQAQTHLVQSEKMSSLGQLVAGVAHEINNPVNFIYGNLNHASEYTSDLLSLVELYQQRYPDPDLDIAQAIEAMDLEFLSEDLPKLLQSMRVGADRIQKIVASLRNFSRMDESDLKPVDIHEGIDSTLMILQNRVKPRADQIGVQIGKTYGTLPGVECFAGQLNQVFMNILSNALDALEERDRQRSLADCQRSPSQIHITTTLLPQNWVQIRIADNGPGMPEAVQQRIFDPFFTTKPLGKGTGMGMSISHQIVVEKHQGHLRCHSTPGQGSEFVIEIPVQRAGNG